MGLVCKPLQGFKRFFVSASLCVPSFALSRGSRGSSKNMAAPVDECRVSTDVVNQSKEPVWTALWTYFSKDGTDQVSLPGCTLFAWDSTHPSV